MHCGTSRRGPQHHNYKTGQHSKVLRKALKDFNKLLHRPIQVRIALYPEGFLESMAKPRPERYFVLVSFPDGGGLPLHAQERVLRAARRKISSRLRQVRDKIASKPSERQERE
jgi:hypothetical protein